MAVTAKQVKELREITAAGMMDCKKALVEADGDLEQAIDILREKGLSKAAKKSGRIAAMGLVRIAFSEAGDKAAIVEVNSETDFVAKNDEFIGFVEDLADIALNSDAKDMDEYMALPYKEEGSVADALTNKIAKIGENMNIRRFDRKDEEGVVYCGYLHGNGNIGVIVGLKTEAPKAEVETVGKDVSMQVASMNPMYLKKDDVDDEYIEKEKKVLHELVINEGKTGPMVDKIVMGKLNKELKEVCLLEQKFVKDNDLTVKQYVDNAAKELGKDIEVVSMVRYEVGEGIEKKEEDFAAEVSKQING